jgi:pimeloyl-ACP methyl ester carboxylesterase
VRFRIDPSKFSPQQKAVMAGNFAALKVYSNGMVDPALRGRLSAITVPTLVVWGESDRVVDPEYGRAYANAIPGAAFQLMAGAGHLPQMETPNELADVVWKFATVHP